jgi:hypothetical protein
MSALDGASANNDGGRSQSCSTMSLQNSGRHMIVDGHRHFYVNELARRRDVLTCSSTTYRETDLNHGINTKTVTAPTGICLDAFGNKSFTLISLPHRRTIVLRAV